MRAATVRERFSWVWNDRFLTLGIATQRKGRAGAALTNRARIAYGRFFDTLRLTFREVPMLGLVPFRFLLGSFAPWP